MKKGKNMMISIGGKVYGYATDCSVSISTSTTSVTSTKYKFKTSGGNWQENESDENSWTMESGYVVSDTQADYEALVKAQVLGKAVDVEYTDVEEKSPDVVTPGSTEALQKKAEGLCQKGKAIITSIQRNDPIDGESTFSVSLTGTGPLEFDE